MSSNKVAHDVSSALDTLLMEQRFKKRGLAGVADSEHLEEPRTLGVGAPYPDYERTLGGRSGSG